MWVKSLLILSRTCTGAILKYDFGCENVFFQRSYSTAENWLILSRNVKWVSEEPKTIPYTMFIKRTKIFPKYFLKMIGGATFVFGGSTQNLLGVPLGVPIGGASGSPNGVPPKKKHDLRVITFIFGEFLLTFLKVSRS